MKKNKNLIIVSIKVYNLTLVYFLKKRKNLTQNQVSSFFESFSIIQLLLLPCLPSVSLKVRSFCF